MRTSEILANTSSTFNPAPTDYACHEVADAIVAGLRQQDYSGIDINVGQWLIQVQANTSCLAFRWIYDRIGNLHKKSTINNGTQTDIYYHANRNEVDIRMSVTKATRVENSETPVPSKTLAKVKDMMASMSEAMSQAHIGHADTKARFV